MARSAAELETHIAAWTDLAAHCLEPNPFYEPWMLLPAVRAFTNGESLVFVFVYECAGEGPGRLCAFFPLKRERSRKAPFAVLTLWKHLHCFHCTPLLRRETAAASLQALRDWARKDPNGGVMIRFGTVSADGPFHQHFSDFLREWHVTFALDESHSRAFLRLADNAETCLKEAISSHDRREFRRRRKHVEALGRLEFRVLEGGASEQPWVQQFLDLEASGWKAARNTALACHDVERDYFVEIARAAHQRGQLDMSGLFLDGRPIALKCSFRSGEGLFVFKPAYDESLSKHAPGTLLELEIIEHAHRLRQVRWMDSCTAPDAVLYNRIWKERRAMQTISFSAGSLAGDFLTGIRPVLWRCRNWFRQNRRTAR